MAALLNIGGADISPNPHEYEVVLQDLDGENTTRSETGVLTRDRIRAGLYTVKSSFYVTKTELKVITDSIAAASFPVVFFDPNTSSYPTATMYAGNRSSKMLAYATGNEANSTWELSFDLIEF